MAKTATKRRSEKLSAAITKEDFDIALKAFSAYDIKISGLKAELEEQIQEVTEEYSSDIDMLQAQQKVLMATMKAYCVENRFVLLTDKAKSFDTLYGKVGFRKDPPSIKTLTGVTLEILTERLKELKLTDYIRTVDQPNKELLLADREKDIASHFPALGIKVVQEEKFFVELKKVELATV